MGIFEKKVVENIVIDIETAEDEFVNFCDAWEIDIDESNMDKDSKIDFDKLKRQIIKAIQKGRLCMNDDSSLKYTFSEKSVDKNGKTKGEITISRPKGSTYLSMDQYKDQQGIHKVYEILGRMSNKPIQFFSDVDGIDMKPLQAVISLFLAE